MKSQQCRDNEKTQRTKRGKKCLWIFLCVVFVMVLGILFWRIILYKSVDEQLAAIEAARAIPDSENAAILYDRILQNPNASLKDQPVFLDPNSDMLTRNHPWTANDYPKLDVWIKKHEWLINELMKVSQLEKCQYPLIVEPNRSILLKRLQMMRKWRFLLCWAANNDVAEGRIDDAIAKWQCMIQIGKHLRQQSHLIEYLEGISTEAVAAHRAIDFLAEDDASERHLQKIESFEVETQDDWTAVLDRTGPVDELEQKKLERQMSLINRLKYKFRVRQFKSRKDSYQIAHEIYLRTLVINRGIYIMVALKRYKNENGRWPQTLDYIKPRVAKDVLTDPHTNDPFVYKLTDDGFVLYSKGPNNIDEGGSDKNGADDKAIWPLKIPQTDKKNTVTEQSVPERKEIK